MKNKKNKKIYLHKNILNIKILKKYLLKKTILNIKILKY